MEFQVNDTVIVTPKARDEDAPWHTEPGKVIEIEDDGWVIVSWDDDEILEEFHPSELEKVE